MRLRIFSSCVIVLVLVDSFIYGEEVPEPSRPCKYVEIYNTWWHKAMEGVYKMKDRTSYFCHDKPVYQQDRGVNFLFFINGTGWKGWMIGDKECLNKGYLSVGDISSYVEDINSTWEEYNSMEWIYNEQMISACHIPGVTHPPRSMKTKAPVINTTMVETTTSPQYQPCDRTTGPLSSGVGIVLYVVLPIGCVVILILIVVICHLCVTNKSLLKDLIREDIRKRKNDPLKGGVRGAGLELNSPIRGGLGLAETADKDSVYEILADPEDACNQNNLTTPPSESAQAENSSL